MGWRGTPASHQETEGRGDVGQENRCSESNRKIRARVIPKKQRSSGMITGAEERRERDMRAQFPIFLIYSYFKHSIMYIS